ADLLRVALGQRAAEHGEVLAEHEHEAAVDRAAAGDDAVAGDALRLHAEIGAVVFDVSVEFLERSLVQQHLEPLARGELALGVLRRDPLLAPAQPGRGAAAFELLDIGGHALSLLRGRAIAKEGTLIQLRLRPCGPKSSYPLPAGEKKRRGAKPSPGSGEGYAGLAACCLAGVG